MNEWLCARKSRHEALASEQQASSLQADPAEDGVEARKGRTQRRGGFYCLRSLELVSWLVGWMGGSSRRLEKNLVSSVHVRVGESPETPELMNRQPINRNQSFEVKGKQTDNTQTNTCPCSSRWRPLRGKAGKEAEPRDGTELRNSLQLHSLYFYSLSLAKAA